MTSLVAFLLLFGAPLCPPASDWQNGSYVNPPARKHIRAAHKDRYHYALGSLGLDREAGKVAHVLMMNESRGDGCAIHHLGRGEWGRGMAGHMVWIHLHDKWGPGPEYILHIPEVVAVMVARTMRRHRSRTWRRVHRAHAGKRKGWQVERFCGELRKRGISCDDPVTRVGSKLGTQPGLWQWVWLAGALYRTALREIGVGT